MEQMEEDYTADLRAILTDNGEEQLFKFAMELGSRGEQEPPLVLHWQYASEFVDAARALQLETFRLTFAVAPIDGPGSVAAPAATEPPFPLPMPLSVHGFKVALLDYLRCESDELPGDPVETSILPYSVDRLGQCAAKMVELRYNPWIQRVILHGGQQILPLAVPYLVRPRAGIAKRFLGSHTRTLWSDGFS